MVEHNLAKVGVAGSSPVFRSKKNESKILFFSGCPGGGTGRHAGLKILWSATAVRVQVPPGALITKLHQKFGAVFFMTMLFEKN